MITGIGDPGERARFVGKEIFVSLVGEVDERQSTRSLRAQRRVSTLAIMRPAKELLDANLCSFKLDNLAFTSMSVRCDFDQSRCVNVGNLIRLKWIAISSEINMPFKARAHSTPEVRTCLASPRLLNPTLHLVPKKLRACPPNKTIHNKKLHSTRR